MDRSWAKNQLRRLSCWKPISRSSDILVLLGCKALRISFSHSLRLITVRMLTICCCADRLPWKGYAQILREVTYFTNRWWTGSKNKITLMHVALAPVQHHDDASGSWHSALWNGTLISTWLHCLFHCYYQFPSPFSFLYKALKKSGQIFITRLYTKNDSEYF